MNAAHFHELASYRPWLARAADDPDDAPPAPWEARAKRAKRRKRVPYRSTMTRKKGGGR